MLDAELEQMTVWLARQDDPIQAAATIARFRALIQSTPSLRAYQRDLLDQLTTVAAEMVADRAGLAGLSPDDPEPPIALIGLWLVQFRSPRNHLDGTRTPAQVHASVSAEVQRAAHVVETGLSSFGPRRDPR